MSVRESPVSVTFDWSFYIKPVKYFAGATTRIASPGISADIVLTYWADAVGELRDSISSPAYGTDGQSDKIAPRSFTKIWG